MISLQDCIAMCGLTEDEILAIAEHEHVPEIVAASLGSTLLQRAHGCEDVCRMIVDDISKARERGDMRHVSELMACLRHFLDQHPEAAIAVRADLA